MADTQTQRLERVLELLARRAQALVQARGVVVLLIEGVDLQVAAAAGVAPAPGTRFPAATSTAGAVIAAKMPKRIFDADGKLGLPPSSIGLDARAALLVPLVHRGRAIGALAALDPVDGGPGFTAEDEELLHEFAGQAASAVASAASMEAERLRRALEAAEAERGRWARELHDQTLQNLAGVSVLLAQAARGRDPEAVRRAVREASELIGEEIEGLRAIIADLRPAALDQLGLEPALRTLVRRQVQAFGYEVDADVELAGMRLHPELETAVYRVAQEALTNVGKHAHARRVELQVRAQEDWLVVRVADDGVGIAEQSPDGGGFGLVGMRERVALLGGALRVDRREEGGTGTVVRAALPLEADR